MTYYLWLNEGIYRHLDLFAKTHQTYAHRNGITSSDYTASYFLSLTFPG